MARHAFPVAMLVVGSILGACSASATTRATTSVSPSSATGGASQAPTVAPSEAWVAFQWGKPCMPTPADLNAICLVRPDGTGQHEVPLATTGDALHPDWSPDGKELAFVVGNEIWVAGVDGSEARSIASCAGDPCIGLDFPAWSPDGSRIAFTRYNGPPLANGPSTSAVELVEVSSRERTVVTETKKLELVDQPRWSPDGHQLVLQIERFSADGTETGAAIATVSSSGGTWKPITDFSLFATYPDWNPTSDTVVFTAHDVDPAATKVGLYTVRSDGSRLAGISYPGSDSLRSVQPTWTPDGKHVLFVQWDSRQTSMVDADGSALQQLGFKSSHPRLRPLP